jgi:hypothetical protein
MKVIMIKSWAFVALMLFCSMGSSLFAVEKDYLDEILKSPPIMHRGTPCSRERNVLIIGLPIGQRPITAPSAHVRH